jgi:hypothetical protein
MLLGGGACVGYRCAVGRSLGPAVAAALLLFLAGPALARGAMVSSTGAAELGGFEALLVHDGAAEDLVVSVAYDGAGGRKGSPG